MFYALQMRAITVYKVFFIELRLLYKNRLYKVHIYAISCVIYFVEIYTDLPLDQNSCLTVLSYDVI